MEIARGVDMLRSHICSSGNPILYNVHLIGAEHLSTIWFTPFQHSRSTIS